MWIPAAWISAIMATQKLAAPAEMLALNLPVQSSWCNLNGVAYTFSSESIDNSIIQALKRDYEHCNEKEKSGCAVEFDVKKLQPPIRSSKQLVYASIKAPEVGNRRPFRMVFTAPMAMTNQQSQKLFYVSTFKGLYVAPNPNGNMTECTLEYRRPSQLDMLD